LHLSENQLSKKGMIWEILVSVAVISCPVHGSLPITDHEFPLMHYTNLISEKHFTVGLPLVIVLPLAEGGTTNEEVRYLIEELHTSGRWPTLVYNLRNETKENNYIHQHGSCIILISELCVELELYKEVSRSN
jgi:predicted alpha/beta-fold hydrolase